MPSPYTDMPYQTETAWAITVTPWAPGPAIKPPHLSCNYLRDPTFSFLLADGEPGRQHQWFHTASGSGPAGPTGLFPSVPPAQSNPGYSPKLTVKEANTLIQIPSSPGGSPSEYRRVSVSGRILDLEIRILMILMIILMMVCCSSFYIQSYTSKASILQI